ncbi:MAG: hypothetical protein Q9170_004088 [Blastenia crenularia]
MGSTWKQYPTSAEHTPKKVPLTKCRKFFAVDASGSTAGHVIQIEGQVVEHLNTHPQDQIVKWGSCCSEPENLSVVATAGTGNALLRQINKSKRSYFHADQGGTDPSQILRNKFATSCVQQSDVWYLMTDGEIYERDVHSLASLVHQQCINNVPVCLLIFGTKQATPELVNISVGIPVYATATEAMILFKDVHSKKLYVIAAKGSFSPLAKVPDSIDLTQWDSLTSFDDDKSFSLECDKLGIQITCSSDRYDTPAVSLGHAWDSASGGVLVDIDALLQQNLLGPEDLDLLLTEESFQQLALICKTRRKLSDLRSFLVRHKREELIVHLEDTHGAREILQRLREPDTPEEERQKLTAQLREAHASNRQAYLATRDSPSEETQAIKKLNRAIDHALRSLAEVEKADYTVDILNRKSNRARRAEMVSSQDAELHLSSLDLADSMSAFRSMCSICCGENQIMSIALKKLQNVEENTSDFFLNFPLVAGQAKHNSDIISSQSICFQCASLIGDRSIFKEELSSIIPVLSYKGENKRYITRALTTAITAGLSTGAAGIVQMFMSILDHTLETKQWCCPQSNVEQPDPEVTQRRQTLQWMLSNLLQTCITRERFSDETSNWVEYPKALKWARTDFETNQLDSWIIQYPLKGFNMLISFYTRLDTLASPAVIERMRVTKLLNVLVSTFMARLLQARNDRLWVYPFMQLIYRGFNSANIPRDMGDRSILDPKHVWEQLENILDRQEEREFLAKFPTRIRSEVCRRVQVIVFWAVFTQQNHITAKGFFQKVALREAVAPALLDSSSELPDDHTLQSILRSIFLEDGQSVDSDHSTIPPFVTPFGPSIIACGNPQCRALFHEPSDPATLQPDAVRKRRADHLHSIFSILHKDATNINETGLPEATMAPERPRSQLYTLHISIAKVWAFLPIIRDSRSEGIFQEGTELSKSDVMGGQEAGFVSRVREHICGESHRGNIYCDGLESEIKELLPSFFDALRVASEKDGLVDKSGLSYVHDWTRNKLADKISYELSLMDSA